MNRKTTLEDYYNNDCTVPSNDDYYVNVSKNISVNDSLLIKLKNIIDDYAIESDGCEEGFTLDAILKDILQRQKTALQKFKQRLSKYSIKDTAKDTIFTRENIDNFINILRGTGKTTRVLKQINLENQFNEDLSVLLTTDVNPIKSLLEKDNNIDFEYDGFEYKEPTNVNVVDFRALLSREIKKPNARIYIDPGCYEYIIFKLLQQLQQNDNPKIDKIKEYCLDQDLKNDLTALDILSIIDDEEDLLNTKKTERT